MVHMQRLILHFLKLNHSHLPPFTPKTYVAYICLILQFKQPTLLLYYNVQKQHEYVKIYCMYNQDVCKMLLNNISSHNHYVPLHMKFKIISYSLDNSFTNVTTKVHTTATDITPLSYRSQPTMFQWEVCVQNVMADCSQTICGDCGSCGQYLVYMHTLLLSGDYKLQEANLCNLHDD